MDVVVDVGDQALYLGRRGPIVEKTAGQVDLGRLCLPQTVEAAVVAKSVDFVHPLLGGDRKGVVQMNDPDGAVGVVDHRHVTQLSPAHHGDGIVEIVMARDPVGLGRHHREQRLVSLAAQGNAPHDVPLRDDADQRPVVAVVAPPHDERTIPADLAQFRKQLADARALREDHRGPPQMVLHQSPENFCPRPHNPTSRQSVP
jgi:hypothetical protein